MKLRTLLIALALVGAFVYFTTAPSSPLRRFEGPLWSGPSIAHSAGLGADEVNNIDIYKAAKDSVAYITSTVYQQSFFFEMVPTRALGSGFLISADGRILTNNHVISGSSKIEVRFSDGSRYTAKVLVADRADDLAMIQIDPKKKLPFLKLGDSDALQVGQKVLAIGNPFGFSGTLTTGIVSSLGREIRNENSTLEGLVQTDAAINEGNSGGPLLDSQGNVIGINTAILAPSGGNIGIGFAMPINRASHARRLPRRQEFWTPALRRIHGLYCRRLGHGIEASRKRRPADSGNRPRLGRGDGRIERLPRRRASRQ